MKSTQGDCIAPSRKGKHINESERQQIEYWRLKGKSVTEIATLLQRHRSTIHRELRRGTVTNIRSDLSEYQVYRAQRAQDDYVRNSGAESASAAKSPVTDEKRKEVPPDGGPTDGHRMGLSHGHLSALRVPRRGSHVLFLSQPGAARA